MKSYTHQTGTKINGFSSHKEHTFYETTTKRQMFLIIEQFATLLKEDSQHWVDKATTELEILKINNIK
jgi:hypothetical protein